MSAPKPLLKTIIILGPELPASFDNLPLMHNLPDALVIGTGLDSLSIKNISETLANYTIAPYARFILHMHGHSTKTGLKLLTRNKYNGTTKLSEEQRSKHVEDFIHVFRSIANHPIVIELYACHAGAVEKSLDRLSAGSVVIAYGQEDFVSTGARLSFALIDTLFKVRHNPLAPVNFSYGAPNGLMVAVKMGTQMYSIAKLDLMGKGQYAMSDPLGKITTYLQNLEQIHTALCKEQSAALLPLNCAQAFKPSQTDPIYSDHYTLLSLDSAPIDRLMQLSVSLVTTNILYSIRDGKRSSAWWLRLAADYIIKLLDYLNLSPTRDLLPGFKAYKDFSIEGFTLLHIATIFNLETLVSLALAGGVYPASKDINGDTAWDIAVCGPYYNSLHAFIKYNTYDINTLTSGGVTALHFLIINNLCPDIILALRHGANPIAPYGYSGKSAINRALDHAFKKDDDCTLPTLLFFSTKHDVGNKAIEAGLERAIETFGENPTSKVLPSLMQKYCQYSSDEASTPCTGSRIQEALSLLHIPQNSCQPCVGETNRVEES